MVSLQPYLDSILASLSTPPVPQEQLNSLVHKALDESSTKSSPENRKSQWEYLLKNEVFQLAMTEGKALKEHGTQYYDSLKVRLDLVLTFTERNACEQTFPFIVLQDLLETQTISSCSHIFSWIEARSARLTEGMVPQKGKALILLRTLNDLLRRLSKTGSTTIFCGRILTFLSGVFPLGERSGVNLRGEYGPTWEDVKYLGKYIQEENDVEMKSIQGDGVQQDGELRGDNMQVDSAKEVKKTPIPQTPAEKKEDFYNTFWHLQLPFSKPPLFASKDTFLEFREAVGKVFPVIKEATAKERAMMGSRIGTGTGALKRKREPDSEETNITEYFFAKFLTSPELLDLEIADTHFRRQFLFQLVILLHHLLTFTKTAKAAWATPRNRSLQMDFTLEPEDAQWVQEALNKTMEELKQTTPNGRVFAETISTILEREKNWIKWKNELCAPFDKEAWSTTIGEEKVGLFEATKELRDKIREYPTSWPYSLGTEPLTEIWEMGYRELWDLEAPFQPGDVGDFVKKTKQEDARIEMRKKILSRTADRLAQAQAQAADKAAENNETPMNVDTSSTSTTLAVPPNPGSSVVTTSPLHPSLPPRPATTQPPSAQGTPVPTNAPSPVPPVPTPAPPVKKPELVDEQIAKYGENKQRWAWLALRTARDQHLQHFGKIGTGDIEVLVQEIEKEKQEREKAQKGEDASGPATSAADESGSKTPNPEMLTLADMPQSAAMANDGQEGVEGDVKMGSQAGSGA